MFLFTLAFSSQQCKKQTDSHNAIRDTENCSYNQHYDSATLAARLIGSWKWIWSYSAWDGKMHDPDKVLIIKLNAAGTFVITENGTITTEGNWSLYFISAYSIQLALDKSSDHFYGDMSLCDNSLLFNDIPVDGPAEMYKRVN